MCSLRLRSPQLGHRQPAAQRAASLARPRSAGWPGIFFAELTVLPPGGRALLGEARMNRKPVEEDWTVGTDGLYWEDERPSGPRGGRKMEILPSATAVTLVPGRT